MSITFDKAKVSQSPWRSVYPDYVKIEVTMLKPICQLLYARRLLQSLPIIETSSTRFITTSNSTNNRTFKSSFRVIQDTSIDPVESERNEKNYKQLLDQYTKHVELAKSGGGEAAVHRHTLKQKKLLASERLRLLLDDEEDFLELGLSAGLGMPYGDVPRAGMISGISTPVVLLNLLDNIFI